jgi:hypothetical protein
LILRTFYVSSRSAETTDLDVQRIVFSARIRNRRLDVTGMLVELDHHFAQWLEGSPEAVEELMSKIRSDRRHVDVQVVTRDLVDKRLFSHWDMAHVYRPDLVARVEQMHRLASAIPERVESLMAALALNRDESFC